MSQSVRGLSRHSGRAKREPGIHNHDGCLWIPGLRQGAHPGMTGPNQFVWVAQPCSVPRQSGAFHKGLNLFYGAVLDSARTLDVSANEPHFVSKWIGLSRSASWLWVTGAFRFLAEDFQ
jgi:hypothetical protein